MYEGQNLTHQWRVALREKQMQIAMGQKKILETIAISRIYGCGDRT